MTRKEAITIIDNLHLIGCGRNQHEDDLKINVALDMAIEALSNNIMESQNDVIKKPRTVRYKLHKPIEYVIIEFDEEENITDMEHYHEVVRCEDCK